MEEKKLSYEELEQVAAQSSAQMQQMYSRMMEMNMGNLFKRLDYLFKVLENKDMFDQEFVASCSQEIKSIITVPEEEQKSEEPKE